MPRNGVTKIKSGYRADAIRAMKSVFLGVYPTKELAEQALLENHRSPRIQSNGKPYVKNK